VPLAPPCLQGIELPPPRALVFNGMSDAMFEPGAWQRFKAFVRQVCLQGAEQADPRIRDPSLACLVRVAFA
jgi:hypothetical protein